MHHTRSKTPVIALVVWCAASILTLGTLKTAQADDGSQSGEMVRQVSMSYTEQCYSEHTSLSEKNLSAADCNMPKTHMEGRSWSRERSCVDLQVPETLVRTLLMEKTNDSIVDLQVPEALLFVLYAEGY